MPTSTPDQEPVWFLRSWKFSVLGVPVQLGAAGLTLPAMLVSFAVNLPSRVDLPLVGVRTATEAFVLMAAAIAALYAHEAGHVVAARAVGMPLRSVMLDSLILSVVADDARPEASDPRRKFWFAVGGPLSDLLCGVVAALLGAFSQGALRWAWWGYAAGAAIQFLNALPMLASGLALVAAGAVLQGGDVPFFPVTLMLAGIVMVVLRLARKVEISDGDQAIAAWRKWRSGPQPPVGGSTASVGEDSEVAPGL